MLLLDDNDELPSQPTDEELAFGEALGSVGQSAIDAALLKHAQKRWLKVARVVSQAMADSGHDVWQDAKLQFCVRRVIRLVDSGVLEAQGDLRKPRWSEVRLSACE